MDPDPDPIPIGRLLMPIRKKKSGKMMPVRKDPDIYDT
jgi:hypothetical protein